MQFSSLGSGSRGNCTVVRNDSCTLLVDCGLGLNHTIQSLASRGISPQEVSAIFVTHEHGDHIRGVRMLANRFNIPVFATLGTLSRINDLDRALVNEISSGDIIAVHGIKVRSIEVPHDAQEPTQFVFESSTLRFGLLTDIGSLNDEVINHYMGCDSLFVESNHDIDMLWNGNDPDFLKHRVAGDLGHLSNHQAKEFLNQVWHDGMSNVVLGHVSQRNNTLEILRHEYEQLGQKLALTIATQDTGTPWIPVRP